MFKETDAQRSLMGPEFLLGPQKAERLKKTWAHAFRELILPMIDEERFASLYHSTSGAPCKSVRAQVCILLFREMFGLTDADALEQYEWNFLWHYAMDIAPDEAHIVRKTLYNFRQRLMDSEKPRRIFEELVDAIVECGKLDVSKQRQDSTHIITNVRQLSRLGLFVETIEAFLRELERVDKNRVKALPERFEERYGTRNGRFADVESAKSRRRLEDCAEDVWFLIRRFESDESISQLEYFERLCRLFDDQCEVDSEDEDDADDQSIVVSETGQPDEEPAQNSAESEDVEVRLRASKEVASDSMQTPHDPDLTYGLKGKGHELQISETYGDNPFQVITYVELTPSADIDKNALDATLDDLEGRQLLPTTHVVDMGYTCADTILKARNKGVDLIGPLKKGTTNEALLHREDFNLHWPEDSPLPEPQACVEGQQPRRVDMTETKKGDNYHYRFNRSDCVGCDKEQICPVRRPEVLHDERHPEKKGSRRHDPALSGTKEQMVIGLWRQREATEAFREEYRFRAAIEGTISEMKRRHRLGDLTVRGKDRLRLDVYMKASALNIKRMLQAWARGELDLEECRSRLEKWVGSRLNRFIFVIFGMIQALRGNQRPQQVSAAIPAQSGGSSYGI